MAKRQPNTNATGNISAQPHLHQHAREIQAYGTVSHALPLELEEPVRLEMTEQLNQLLAGTESCEKTTFPCKGKAAELLSWSATRPLAADHGGGDEA